LELVSDLTQGLSRAKLDSVVLEAPSAAVFFFQTGCLTVDRVIAERPSTTERSYRYFLRKPNLAVKDVCYYILRGNFWPWLEKDWAKEEQVLRKALLDCDEVRFTQIVNSLYSSVPLEYQQDTKSFYQAVLHACCWGLKKALRTKYPRPGEYADFVLELSETVTAVIELEQASSCSENEAPNISLILSDKANLALESLRKKDWTFYQGPGRTVIFAGLGVCGKGQALAKIVRFDKVALNSVSVFN
jgi:hypothetical protein